VLNFCIERYREAYLAELDAFVTAASDGLPMSPSFADGVEAMRLAVAAEESLKTGAAVTLD
jgi:myo-inositol 2-dehydrogenase / D-chiro-inositol 1-dehydrogenase